MVAMNATIDNAKAREILERKIEQGRASAARLLEHVQTRTPVDTIATGSALRFGTRAFDEAAQRPELVMSAGDKGMRVHKHALSQLAQRAGVPTAYASELAEGAPWQRQLLAGLLNEHYHQGTPNGRYLVRQVQGRALGFLSDRYRRLDSRPLVDAFAAECQAVGAVPVDGVVSETRVALRALLPTVLEPVPGEALTFGVEWSNSDFGNGTHSVRAFMMRVWCLNGATTDNALTQVHLGSRLESDIALSARTYALDTKRSVSALRDVVQATLAPTKVSALCGAIAAAHEKGVEWKSAKAGLAKRLLKSELAQVEAAFSGPDTYNLPAGNTVWRMSNALSWVANSTDDAERRMHLQRLAGEVVDGRRDRAEVLQ